MSNITYLCHWKPELCIQLNTEDKNLADFNRLIYKGVPTTMQIKQSVQLEDACRKGIIAELKERFDEACEEGSSHIFLYSIFTEILGYLKWCDKQNYQAFQQNSLERYMAHLQNRVMLGEIKNSTYRKSRSYMMTLFVRYLDRPHNYFDNVVIMDNSETTPFEAYTRSDLAQLLPFLRQLFNQTYKQFIEAPNKHKHVFKNKSTMTFKWKGENYQLCSGITKMMCAATYLLAYYTYANSSDLLQLPQPKNASTSLSESWYVMPAFKRRAFKTIQVEMGSHELEVPKYAMSFFDKLLNASYLISKGESATLLQTIPSKIAQPLTNGTLQSFLRIWVEKHFTFIDQTGQRLRPMISRFRETGAQITAYHQGEIVNNIMLNNTLNTRKRHYSKGNIIGNNGMIQDVMSIREEQVKNDLNAKQAQQSLGINVLVVEAENKINIPNLSRTPNGASCINPFGEKSKKYTNSAQKKGLAKKGERLACADLLGCFGCPSQVIVQSVADIWCLLSFKACIEESLYLHLDVSHYRKNFENIVKFIELKIIPNINQRTLKQAETKLANDGYHPFWDESESVLGLIPKSTNEAL